MKKLLSIALTLVLMLSLGTVALANGQENPEDWTEVTINKDLTIVNEGTVNPAETFTFTVGEGSGVRDGKTIVAPAFDSNTFTINIAQGEDKGFTNINLPTFTQVGVYTYPINEVAGNTAGMRYDDGEYNLVVTVINNPDGNGFLRVLTLTNDNNVKEDAFKNDFLAGDLTIKKEITGNYSDPNDEFEVTVTVTPDEGKVINAGPIVWNTANVIGNSEEGYTLVYTLKGGESITIQNLPYDVSYNVVETDPGEYVVSYDNNQFGEFNSATKETTITNKRDTTIETGVNLNSLPYILILGIAAAGLIGFAARRRFSTDD